MATSGSVDFTSTRTEIITRAYKSVGLIQKSESLTSDELTFGADILNEEIKYLSTLNPHIWKRRVGYLFPEKDKFSYKVGTQSADDNVFNSYLTTTTTAALAASDTVVAVTDSTGFSNSDIVGVVLDAGTIHWDTIASVDSSTQITLTTGVATAAASGNRLYVGSAKIDAPVKVYSFWREIITGTDDVVTRSPIEEVAYDDYYRIYGNQLTNSSPTHVMFDNRAVEGSATLNHGIMHISPTADQSNANYVVGFVYEAQIEDMDNASENPDLPSEWIKLLRLSVANVLCTSDGVPERIANRVERQYKETLDVLLNNDSDNSTFFIQPDPEETLWDDYD